MMSFVTENKRQASARRGTLIIILLNIHASSVVTFQMIMILRFVYLLFIEIIFYLHIYQLLFLQELIYYPKRSRLSPLYISQAIDETLSGFGNKKDTLEIEVSVNVTEISTLISNVRK